IDSSKPDCVRNIAHLVSLEGFAPYLVDLPNWGSYTKVRLASLASWSFTCKPRGGSFRHLMLNLIKDQPKGGDRLRLALPVKDGVQQAESDRVKKALQQGYAALPYDTRTGEHSFAWYHGPFVPHPVAPFSGLQHFASSAAATINDSDTGAFDLAYAPAMEIGPLL